MQAHVMSCWACVMHACVHGACALTNMGASKYLNCLACTQANSNLVKITTTCFWVLNTQNANRNMPNMILIAYLNENLPNCNENFAWGKQEPLVQPACLGTKQKVRKQSKLHFTFISCRYHNFYIKPILILIEFQHATHVESCLGSVLHAGPP